MFCSGLRVVEEGTVAGIDMHRGFGALPVSDYFTLDACEDTKPNKSAAAKPVDRSSFRFAVHVY